ncbi:aspartate aminotransferase family protein [Paenibacillus sp. CGMCC 1.16610]|uniref:Aminotransferase class III-fold pyridoxal phosphate-dependent enzyme n=1 Tax=Paenibacillus anseongense TaxID=2682845 RepID=A0ABW9UII9_9BACL|nr:MULTISPECIES: aspartate aminotransferase family protein [Paenibacillus]MBA2941197.1 aspartate aminotransferase family protein [Paenibacillus sp. CGMCC 1.16610]MVQ40017.1 aminotransferase class III-fold pyridoxal phosphate-dependent enzyme [Paenibacillus anseongense]
MQSNEMSNLPTKEELLEKDRKYVWHHMSAHNENPMILASGEGSWVTDVDGNRYLDGMSGLWCVNVGHGRKEIAEAAAAQMMKLAYATMVQSHIPSIELAAKLNEWLDGDYRIFFSNSGSDANEVAFKIARQYFHQNGKPTKHKFISRHRAYHGNSMGALGATGQAQRKLKYEPLGVGFQHVPPPYCYRCPFGQKQGSCSLQCAKAIEDVIVWEGPDSVAGIIMEPVITGGGVIVPPDEYLKTVRSICDKYDVLLIVDEVICGFGRSGEKFGHLNYGVRPDIVTMAKGMTSAYSPLSATAVSAELYDSFKNNQDPTSHLRHINTFGGNPVSCVVALKNIEILENENLVARSAQIGDAFKDGLKPLLEHPHIGEIRIFGSAMGIELVEDVKTKEPATAERVMSIIAACKQKGLLIGKNGDTVPGYANILTLSPPFSSTDDDIAFIIDTLLAVFDAN